NKRIDGRDMKTIRPIATEVGLLPRVHGSALFQRGETQAIVTTTLGTSTGETKPMRGPGRREIGHGALAERALARMMPEQEKFPYTIRIVSETLESNGSSSMAAVCGGTLSLMDAGVPMKSPVAGIAMGLISDGALTDSKTRIAILSDILGDEDHLGDMDFKICGLSREVLTQALEQAREGRLHILDKMLATLAQPRPDLSKWAPRITQIKVKPDQIRLIIGPGGKTIKGIIDQTGVAIDVEDDGTVNVASADSDAVKKALDIIKGLTTEPEVGAVYSGTVTRVADFGAFIEILPGTDGLLHVSEMAHHRVDRVYDVMKEGDPVEVKILSVDRDGKIRLTRRELLPFPEGPEGEAAKKRLLQAREQGGPPPRSGGGGGRERGGPRDRG